MEEQVLSLNDYLAILSRRRMHFIVPALLMLLMSLALAFGLPSIYKSEATILIEQQEVPAELVRSTVTSYAGERVQIISQQVMNTENLARIIEQYGLYSDHREDTSLSMLADTLREEIHLEMVSADVVDPRSGRPTTATIAFKLSYSDKDPRTAQKVTNELVSLFLNENLKRRTQSAVQTSSFLSAEADKLNQQVKALETQLATFKEAHINALPELQEFNIQFMERTDLELKSAVEKMRSLEERKIYLRSQLAMTSPYNELYNADGKRILTGGDRLKALETEYLSLSARYSPRHPQVARLQREIRALKAEIGKEAGEDPAFLEAQLTAMAAQLAGVRERYAANHPEVVKIQRNIENLQTALKHARASKAVPIDPDNPAYIQLQSQLTTVESDLRSLTETKTQMQQKLADYEKRLAESPEVEREYRSFMRDYENAVLKYKEIRAKQLEAELAESLERESKGERFSLVEPPLVPEKPEKPNRLAILFLGFVFSLGGGLGSVAVAEGMSNAIKDPRALTAITGTYPLVVVPFIETSKDKERRRRFFRLFILGLVVAGVVVLLLFHFTIMPLDVAWFALLRRLGLETI